LDILAALFVDCRLGVIHRSTQRIDRLVSQALCGDETDAAEANE
jgi:hypothetical protein